MVVLEYNTVVVLEYNLGRLYWSTTWISNFLLDKRIGVCHFGNAQAERDCRTGNPLDLSIACHHPYGDLETPL